MNGHGDRVRPRRPAPGSRPSLKAFLPFLALGVVILLALIWIFFLGPAGRSGTPPADDGATATERLDTPAPRG